MPKVRETGTFEKALFDNFFNGSAEYYADMLDVSPQTLANYSSHEHSSRISINQACRLDQEWSRENGGTPPMLRVYQSKVEQAIKQSNKTPKQVTLEQVMMICCELGRLLFKQKCDPGSVQQREISGITYILKDTLDSYHSYSDFCKEYNNSAM